MNPKSACVDGIYLFIYCTYGNIKCDAGMGEDAEGCVQAFQEKEERRGDASEALQLFDGSKQKQLKKIDTASVIYFYFNEEKNLGVVLSYSFCSKCQQLLFIC